MIDDSNNTIIPDAQYLICSTAGLNFTWWTGQTKQYYNNNKPAQIKSPRFFNIYTDIMYMYRGYASQ